MGDTLEHLDELKQMAREFLPREFPQAPFANTREMVRVLNLSSDFVRLLMLIWSLEQARLRGGGVAAELFVQDCDLLLALAADAKDALARNEDALARGLPGDMAQPMVTEVQEATQRLDALIEHVSKARDWAARPQRVAPDLGELKKRTRQAEEGKEWIKLTDAVLGMRAAGASKQE